MTEKYIWDWLGAKPLQHFYKKLFKSAQFRAFAKKHFDEYEREEISEFLAGKSTEPPSFVEDAIHDEIHNEADCPWSTEALGSVEYGPYDVCVRSWGGVFFVQAMEHDDIGYFGSLEDAKDAAISNYGAAIDYYDEQE